MKKLFFVEITDTFGGEANYSWVTRHILKAKSERGAACRLSRLSGLNWHFVGAERWDSKSGASCAFIREYDPETDNEYSRIGTDDRGAA